MKILIVDDQYENVKIVASAIRELGLDDITHVTSIRDALKEMKTNKYDLLVLDLQLPAELGEEVNPLGGKELLDYMDIHDGFNNPTHILAITSHSDSYNMCLEYFNNKGWFLLHGHLDKDAIKGFVDEKRRHIFPNTKVDVAILTALEHTELEAVRALPCNWETIHESNECNFYYKGVFETTSGVEKKIVATSCPRMGMASAAAVAMKLCLKFQPSFLIMTGIAAGIQGKANIGDILIADPCWDWGSGKLTVKDGKVKFLSAPYQISLDPRLRTILRNIAVNRTYLDEIYDRWDGSGNQPSHQLNVKVGPIATGSLVLEDPDTVVLIQSQHRETIGVEMEAYGVLAAANAVGNPPPKTIIIKSVCDFADPSKNDEWQKYAAYTSSALAYRLITQNLFE